MNEELKPFDPTRDILSVSTRDTREIKLNEQGGRNMGFADITALAASLGIANMDYSTRIKNTSYGKSISKEERQKRKNKKKLSKSSKRKNR